RAKKRIDLHVVTAHGQSARGPVCRMASVEKDRRQHVLGVEHVATDRHEARIYLAHQPKGVALVVECRELVLPNPVQELAQVILSPPSWHVVRHGALLNGPL